MSIILDTVELSDLEMLLNSAFAPLNGFLCQKDYQCVLDQCRLSDGTVWPVPIVLTSQQDHNIGDKVNLCLSDGTI